MLQTHQACKGLGVAAPFRAEIDTLNAAAEAVCQISRRTAQARTEVQHPGSWSDSAFARQLLDKPGAADVILIGDFRQRVFRKILLCDSFERSAAAQNSRDNPVLTKPMLPVKFLNRRGAEAVAQSSQG